MFGPMVDEETQGWVLDSFDWAIENGLLTAQTPLILPDRESFPIPKAPHDQLVPELVQRLAGMMGIGSAPIRVEALDVLPPEYRYDPTALSAVGGTWQSDGTEARITYDPAMVATPLALIATMAHEVMHHRLHLTALDLPGGAEAEELSTDLHCITMGFGVVQMAGAEQAGWQGYLRQETRAFALAVFHEVTGCVDPGKHLPKRSARLFGKAKKLLKGWEDDLADVRAALR